MVRVISQETFDSVVKENMDDFGLEKEEAIKEAISQFESQGVNLANIITSNTSHQDHLVVNALKKLSMNESENSEDEIIEACKSIGSECSKGLAEKMVATKEGAYDKLIEITINEDKSESARNEALAALAALLDTNPDPFDQRGFVAIMQGLSSPSMTSNALELALVVCVRHEHNRQNLMRNDILKHLDAVFDSHPVRVARIWQALVQDDDVRVPYGKAHENARAIVEEHQGLQKLCGQLEVIQSPQELALLLSCLSSLTVRNEYCQLVSDIGLQQVFHLLLQPEQNNNVLKEVLSVLKTLAGNDNVKKDICISQKLPAVIATLSSHLSHKGICHAGSSALGAICLRMPDNAQQVVTAGGAKALIQVLRTHKANAKISVS